MDMSETTLEAPAPIKEELPRVATLTFQDRCDSCGAQAYVTVLFETGELNFCGHHYRTYESKLSTSAVRVVDERWQLTGARLDVSS